MIIKGVEYLDPHKKSDSDKVYWLTKKDESIGEFLFSFDLKKVYNIYTDYPEKLSNEELRVFNKENPFWVDYFSIT